jgi:hypothetical protein
MGIFGVVKAILRVVDVGEGKRGVGKVRAGEREGKRTHFGLPDWKDFPSAFCLLAPPTTFGDQGLPGGFFFPFGPLLAKLEISLSKILNGDERYIATVPDNYHNILFQLHHLWVEHLQKSGRLYQLGYVCGWEDSGIPPEVDFALSHLPESLAIEREDGWMIFSKTGALENHYCILRREGTKYSSSIRMRICPEPGRFPRF